MPSLRAGLANLRKIAISLAILGLERDGRARKQPANRSEPLARFTGIQLECPVL